MFCPGVPSNHWKKMKKKRKEKEVLLLRVVFSY